MKILFKEENILNVPNMISFYRLVMFPVILVLAYIEKIFVLLKIDDIRPGVKGLYWLLKKE
jgi:phosphatidylglycerophosphate synthase